MNNPQHQTRHATASKRNLPGIFLAEGVNTLLTTGVIVYWVQIEKGCDSLKKQRHDFYITFFPPSPNNASLRYSITFRGWWFFYDMNEENFKNMRPPNLVCYADIYIDTHCMTGKPLQIHASHWNGATHLLSALYDEDIDLLAAEGCLSRLPLNKDISVRIVFKSEDCGEGFGPLKFYPDEFFLLDTVEKRKTA